MNDPASVAEECSTAFLLSLFFLIYFFSLPHLFQSLAGSASRIWTILLCLLFVFHAAALIRRNAAWRSDESLFSAGIKISKTNAKLFNNLGHALETKGQLEKALRLYQRGEE